MDEKCLDLLMEECIKQGVTLKFSSDKGGAVDYELVKGDEGKLKEVSRQLHYNNEIELRVENGKIEGPF